MKAKRFRFSDIALGNLKRRKRQYILLTVGIVLAIFFVSSILLFGFGIYTSIDDSRIKRYGKQDIILFDCENAPVDELLSDGTFSSMGKIEILAQAIVSESEADSFCIAKIDEQAIELKQCRLRKGAFPEHAGEIALEQSALARLRTDADIGNTITLTLSIPDGESFLDQTLEKTYTLTGILYDQLVHWDFAFINPVYHDFPAGILSIEEQIEPGGRGVTNIYAALRVNNKAAEERVNSFCTINGLLDTYGHPNNIVTNRWFHQGASSDNNMMITGITVGIVGIMLVLACCMGIVNSFTSNLETRRKQIGLLRAVGATSRQIKRIFGRETLIIAVCAVPIGLGLAIFSISCVFSWMGEQFVIYFNPWVVIGVAVLSVACIMLASSIPLKRAANISPMQAIRDVDLMRRVKRTKFKSKKQFVVPRLIAQRNNTVYKTKRIGIAVMLALGVIIFTLTAMFAVPLRQNMMTSYRNMAEYELWDDPRYCEGIHYEFHDPGFTEGDKREIEALPLVQDVIGRKTLTIKFIPKEITPYATADGWCWRFSYLSPDVINPIYDQLMTNDDYERYQRVKTKYGYSDYLRVNAFALEEDIIKRLKPYVYEGSINIDKLRSGEEILIVAPEKYEYYFAADEDGRGGCEGFVKIGKPNEQLVSQNENDMFNVGDEICLSLLYSDAQQQNALPDDAVRIDRTVKIGALLLYSDREDYHSAVDTNLDFLDVITTIPGLSALEFDVPYSTFDVKLSETPDSQTEAYLDEALEHIALRVPDATMHSRIASARENRRTAYQVIVFCSSLVILMLIMTASMINNAISAHIRAGKRSIGTLRAVGASDRDVFKSYLYQVLSLFKWGGSIGYILSMAAVFYLLSTDTSSNQFNGMIPFWQPFVFLAVLFGICIWNIRVRLRAVLKKSITDNIREL